MPLIPIKLPPGMYRNGTEYEQSNRWRDGSLVRWSEGSIKPVGGWSQYTTTSVGAAPRGMFGWRDNNGNRRLAVGTYAKLYSVNADGSLVEITPATFTTGREDAEQNAGFGGGTWGAGTFGTPRNPSSVYQPATTWSLDNFGELLVACSTDDGQLLEWDLDSNNDAVAISNAPTSCQGLIVTEERFIFALGAGGNPRKVSWCDRENRTDWTALATNEAGDIELQTNGEIICAARVRGRTLILTSSDAHTATYQGPPYVYGFERVGSACGTASPNSLVSADAFAFWWGNKGFFVYDGSTAQEMPCDVSDYVFRDYNVNQASKVYGYHNSRFSEIWWFYPSSGSLENDRYVVYDYKDRVWFTGDLARTAAVDVGPKRYPIYTTSDGYLYLHEYGYTHGSDSVYLETGPISLGNGDNVMRVTSVIPDEDNQGDVNMKFKTKLYPNGSETTTAAFSTANPTDVRFTGRQIKMRFEGQNNNDFRIGTFRIDARPGGKR